MIKLVVGLGNIGDEYKLTRHNIGFEAVEALVKSYSAQFKPEKKRKAHVASFEIQLKKPEADPEEERKSLLDNIFGFVKSNEDDDSKLKVVVIKPTTYMNLSGDAILKAMSFYKIKPEDILVIHDDVALDFGAVRGAFDRGAGGQHGIEDTIRKIGSKAFYRLRVGVGPDPGGEKRGDYVLGRFPKAEQAKLPELKSLTKSMFLDWINAKDIRGTRSI